MARPKKPEHDPLAEWRAIQLTPDQKAAARAELEALAANIDDAAPERLLAWRGRVQWSLSYDEMADKIDDRD